MGSSADLFMPAFIDYQARLQHLDDRDTLSRTHHKLPVEHISCSCFVPASASLTDLRLKEDTPSLSHRHSFSDVRRLSIHVGFYLIHFLVCRRSLLGKSKEEVAADTGKVRRGATARQQ